MKTPLLAMIFMSLMAVSNAQDIVKPVFWLTWEPQHGFIDKGTANNVTVLVDSNAVFDSSGINYNPAYIFSGTEHLVAHNLVFDERKITVMVVYYPDSLANDQAIYVLKNDTDLVAALAPKWLERYNRRLGFGDSVLVQAHINVLESQIRSSAFNGFITSLSIAKNDRQLFKGNIAELLIFQGKLDKKDRERYETYLALKYGVTLQGDHYRASNDSIVWAKKQKTRYHHDIIGIAKDSLLNLHQKQSKNSEIILAAGKEQVTNILNQNSLPEQSYLLIGATKGVISNFNNDTLAPNAIYAVSEKRWLVSVFNDSLKNISTQLVLHADAVRGADSLFLIIQRSDSGSFEFVFPDSLDAEGRLYFNNLHWDIDGSGSDLLRLATFPRFNQNSSIPGNSSIFGGDDQTAFLEQNQAQQNGLQLVGYPNPSNENFQINVQTTSTEQTEVSITDVTGRVYFYSTQAGQNAYTLQGPHLAPGTYFIKANSSLGVKFTKIIIY